MLRVLLIAICMCSLLTACGYREGAIQKDELSYVLFSGDWRGATIQIDSSEPILLKGTPEASPILKYGLSTGKHVIQVTRDGRLLLNRVVFLSNQQTMEVRIP